MPSTQQNSEDVSKWSISELRKFLKDRDVDISKCIEKDDLVQLARAELVKEAAAQETTTTSSSKRKKAGDRSSRKIKEVPEEEGEARKKAGDRSSRKIKEVPSEDGEVRKRAGSRSSKRTKEEHEDDGEVRKRAGSRSSKRVKEETEDDPEIPKKPKPVRSASRGVPDESPSRRSRSNKRTKDEDGKKSKPSSRSVSRGVPDEGESKSSKKSKKPRPKSTTEIKRSKSTDEGMLRRPAPPSFAEAVFSGVDFDAVTKDWSIPQFKVFLDYAQTDYSDCLEREDYKKLVDQVATSNNEQAVSALDFATNYPAIKTAVESWSIPELECALERSNIDYSDCLEREDYISLIKKHPEVIETARNVAHKATLGASSCGRKKPPSYADCCDEEEVPDDDDGTEMVNGTATRKRRGRSTTLKPRTSTDFSHNEAKPPSQATTPRRRSLSEKLSKRMSARLQGKIDTGDGEENEPSEAEKYKYYEVLGIAREATAGEVTKAYYALAKSCHPDKHPDDPDAEERFRQISEAYKVLSNPDMRARYDATGTATEDTSDPQYVFRMLFGAGRFDNYFPCPLAHAASKAANDDGNNDDGTVDEALVALYDDLATKLLELLQRVTEEGMGTKSRVKEFLTNEADEMGDAPGGLELLNLLGTVYVMEAKQHSKAFLGIPAFFVRARTNTHVMRETIAAMNSATKMDTLARQTDGDDNPVADDEMVAQGLRTLWRSGKLEIETSIHTICETVFNAAEDSKEQKQFCSSLKAIGKFFTASAKEAKKER